MKKAVLIEASLEEDDGIDEEVAEILSSQKLEAVDRVDLSGRQLKFLPEAFGKLRGLIALRLSHNQLEVGCLLCMFIQENFCMDFTTTRNWLPSFFVDLYKNPRGVPENL